VDVEEIFCLAQLKGWLWIMYKMTRTSLSYSDWHFSPVKCLQSFAKAYLDNERCKSRGFW